MDTLIVVVFALIMMKLADDVAIGLDNTFNHNHADQYWMAPALLIFALGIFLILV